MFIIHSRVIPSSTWSVLHPGGPALVPSDWGIWASPPETDQDSCPGWLPLVPLDSCLPQEGFFLVPLPLDLSASLPPVFKFIVKDL